MVDRRKVALRSRECRTVERTDKPPNPTRSLARASVGDWQREESKQQWTQNST